jgi:NarL family two-component system response regulator LiaR
MNSTPGYETHLPTQETPVTVVIIDDDQRLVNALQALFESSGDIDVLAVGYSAEDAERLAIEHQPQVILLDLQFPEGISGIEAARRLSANPGINSRILVYTIVCEERIIFEAIKAGANSYVWKDGKHEDLIEAILATSRGEAYISPSIARMVLELFEAANRENKTSESKAKGN